MPPVLHLVQRPVSPSEDTARIAVRDVYDLDALDLDAFAGVMIGGACDQRFLGARTDRLSEWVRAGGRLLVNGHPLERFVDGMPKHRKLDFHSTRDLWLTAVGAHPIWDGVDRRDVLFNTGVPGQHTFEDLERVGVAGFYAHAYLVDLPEDAVVITGIGQGRLPVDASYPLGSGEVIVHLGNDLLSFTRPGTSAADMGERTLAYLEGARVLQEAAR
ncbi:hypothetical protein [Rhodococcus sp. HNM0569]|uniref:hypothetical protein n=1 Tax=Rhodococcus sp. HNM0569 TaxID=2716340 RepID=UPI001469F5B5|nr:hypothetical protein [Rhodococcus sp. HNM0569]NLU82634.1 hypothetical protein [Rhodococcus sp. HNM0569]